MRKRLAVPILALAAALGGTARATPLEELDRSQLSRLEFGSFKLETALAGIRDWPFPVEGAGVPYQLDPDRIDIVVAVRKVDAESFRDACARTLGRVREFLYVNADGVAPMGRSHLVFHFRGPWRGGAREAASRALDASTRIRVDVVGRGTCRAALVGAAVTFEALAPR
jgi:hypothetical protein